MLEIVTVIAVGGGLASLAMPLARRRVEVLKGCTDIILGEVGLVLSLPLLLICAVIIKLSSRGPVFLRQTRVGKDGRLFEMCKLRTMYADAESQTGAVWASDNDPRVVPACRWMRHSHVDELPQLINVIRGEMSLVGPRPERPEILAELGQMHPTVRSRLAVLPGITGLAQIVCGYDTTPERFAHKLQADLNYIARRSWLLDLDILLATVPKFFDRQPRSVGWRSPDGRRWFAELASRVRWSHKPRRRAPRLGLRELASTASSRPDAGHVGRE